MLKESNVQVREIYRATVALLIESLSFGLVMGSAALDLISKCSVSKEKPA
jgi:hypothetical protein